MKNLVISNSLWNIYNFRLGLVKQLSKKGKIVIYCDLTKKTFFFKKKLPKNIVIKNLSFSSKSKNLFRNLKLIFQIYHILKKERPDNIFTFTLKPNLYCGIINNLFKYSFFPTLTGLGTAKNRGGILFLLVKLLIMLSFKSSKKIFVHNKSEKKFLKEIGFSNNKIIQVNGSGINLSNFRFLKYTEKISNKYLFVGRLIADKGIYELVNAFRILNKNIKMRVTLTLAVLIDKDNSTSIELDRLKKEITGLNIKVKKNAKNIKKLLKSHGCLILPSYSEGMSRSIMEAVSSARPVICSNINGCKEMVIENHNGLLVKPKSTISIYRALLRFSNLPLKDKIKFGKNGRKLVKKNRFDEKYVVTHYLNQIKNNEIFK